MPLESLSVPHSEDALIGSVLDGILSGNGESHAVLMSVPSDAFVGNYSRMVWSSMRDVYQRGELPDFPAIRAELRNKNLITTESGWLSVQNWLSALETYGDMPFHQREVVEFWHRRQANSIFRKAVDSTTSPLEPIHEVLSNVAQESMKLMEGREDGEVDAGKAISALLEHGNAFRLESDCAKIAHFGITEVDEAVRGTAGEMVIITGRPGMGKTALAIQSLCSTALEGHRSLFVSLELPQVEALARIASWFTHTPSGALWAGRYSRDTQDRMKDAQNAANRITVWATPSLCGWARVEAKIRGAVIRKGVRVVFIDYFGLIGKPQGSKGSNDSAAWGELSGKIRSLAQQLRICIVLLAQLNRDGEGEPSMSDLRDTGQLEQDAQTILALWGGKPDGKNYDSDPFGTKAERSKELVPFLRILKNRNGKSGEKWQIDFDGPTNRMDVARGRT